jgi:hypothetical protein
MFFLVFLVVLQFELRIVLARQALCHFSHSIPLFMFFALFSFGHLSFSYWLL